MYTSLKFFVSSRTFFHLVRPASLGAYKIYRLRFAAWKTTNGYMGCVGRKTRSEKLVSEVTSSLRCSGGPMNGPRRRKSKGIGWRAKLVKDYWVKEKRWKRTREFTKHFFVSIPFTESVLVRCSVRMTETSISQPKKDGLGHTYNNGLTTWRYYLPTVPSRNYRPFLFARLFPRVPPSGSRHKSPNPARRWMSDQIDAVGRDLR